MADAPEKKVVVLSPAGSKVSPSDLTRQAPAVQDSISDPMKRETETGSFKKLSVPGQTQEASPARTIKLKPLQSKSSESPVPAESPISAEALSPAPSSDNQDMEDDATIKIDKVPKLLKPNETGTGMPGAKHTIKLRPSSGSESAPVPSEGPKPSSPSTLKLKPVTASAPAAQEQQEEPGPSEEQTVSMQKKTIKLSPTRPGVSASPEPSAPSAPTMKMEESAATVQPPRPAAPTVKLAPDAPPPAPVPTVQQGAPASEEQHSAPASGKRTLKLKSHTSQTSAPPPSVSTPTGTAPAPSNISVSGEGTESGMQKQERHPVGAKSDEPNIIFTLAACFAFLALAYFTWMNIGQFGEQYLGWQTANVPGLSGQIK